ncbi:MAG: hypothetical protein K2H70_06125, partial [Bacteroidales bacterium]|nr:hypothetical protein [Bacteroidales bacterium]
MSITDRIWIGLGVTALGYWLTQRLKKPDAVRCAAAVGVAAVCLVAVPGIMAQQGWDDHNRGQRTSARDFARNTLESCEPNAVLICDGDNDTFPLWYCQQVEGIRTDVRVINSMLAHSSWLIQPLYRQVYESAPLKFSLPHEAYEDGSNDIVLLHETKPGSYSLQALLEHIADPGRNSKVMAMNGEWYNCIPTKNVYLAKPDSAFLARTGLYTPEQIAAIPDRLTWRFDKNKDNLTKSNLVILDIVANNLWDRPIYCTSPYAHQAYLPMGQAQREGMLYRWVPYTNANKTVFGDRLNGMNADRSYRLLTDSLEWGSIPNDPALDPETRSWSMIARQQYALVARALIQEGRRAEAERALDKGLASFPDRVLTYDTDMLAYLSLYYIVGASDKAEAVGQRLLEVFENRLRYVEAFPARFRRSVAGEEQLCLQTIQRIRDIANAYHSPNLANSAGRLFSMR